MNRNPFERKHSIGAVFCGLVLAGAITACATTAPSNINIAQATAVPDDTKVVVTGALVQQLDEDQYLLRDDSGQITTVIDRDKLGDVKIAPDARLRVYGEIDQSRTPPRLIAKTVQLVR